ncbi:MAG: O-methyltransferase [Nocardioidaceae bacterium]
MYHRKDVTFSKPSIFRAGIEEYALRVSTAPSDEVAKIARETVEKCPQWADIASYPIQAKLLSMLVAMTRARHVLEVGTFTGHATLEMAEALPEDGSIVTIDNFVADEHAREIATTAFRAHEHGHRIELLEMDALSALEVVEGPFDLIFIDADKPNYKSYYEKIVGDELLARDGVLLIDNTLWGGRVLDLDATEITSDTGTELTGQDWVDNMLSTWGQHVIEFNEHVLDDPRVENVMLTVHDGMTLIRHATSY